MEKQRSQAVAELEIFDHSVKCQRCAKSVPLIEDKDNRLTTSLRHAMRIDMLQKRITWIEKHYTPYNGYPDPTKDKDLDLQKTKQELADLLAENAELDKLRRIPLNWAKVAGKSRMVCSECWPICLRNSEINQRRKKRMQMQKKLLAS